MGNYGKSGDGGSRLTSRLITIVQALVKSGLPDHGLVLDLKEVKLVNRDAVRFLAEIEAQGAKLQELLRICSSVDFARAGWNPSLGKHSEQT